MTDEDIRAQAIQFAKRNKNRIAKELTDIAKYAPDSAPVSLFMAGSPGAGKTEFSKNLIEILEEEKEHRAIRIDGDDMRPFIPGYTGNNSSLFQGAISLITEKVHDYALHNKQSFVFDSTFSKYEKAADNIRRSLEKERSVFIFYVYQKPEVAWRFTQAREKAEGRNIPKSAFIEQFLGARETIKSVIEIWGDRVVVSFVKKDFEKNTLEDIFRIQGEKDEIDRYMPEGYTKEKLEKYL